MGPMSLAGQLNDTDSCAAIPALLGHVVAVTGHRRSEELAAHLRSFGAIVLLGPMLHTKPISDDDTQLHAVTAAIIARPPDYLVATTGIGIRSWMNAAATWGVRSELLDALRATKVLARGPKVVGAVYEAGLDVFFVDPSGHTMSMIEHLEEQSLDGANVVIQLPGDDMAHAERRLREAGAEVTSVAVYDWTWPEDLTAPRRLVRAIAERRVSAVTFTSRPAVRNFAALATEEGIKDEVDAALSDMVCVCVGSVTAEELRRLTGALPCQPDDAMLGMMVQVVADEVMRREHHHVRTPAGGDVVVQGRLVHSRGVDVMTSDREAAVLQRLIATPRRTVGRDALLRAVWRGEAVDASVLETTMARLRRRLSGSGLTVTTISGRGYLLDGDVAPCPLLAC